MQSATIRSIHGENFMVVQCHFVLPCCRTERQSTRNSTEKMDHRPLLVLTWIDGAVVSASLIQTGLQNSTKDSTFKQSANKKCRLYLWRREQGKKKDVIPSPWEPTIQRCVYTFKAGQDILLPFPEYLSPTSKPSSHSWITNNLDCMQTVANTGSIVEMVWMQGQLL